MRPTRSNLGFADRLRNYSRMVSNKLELSRHSAMNMVALSAAAGAALSAHHSAEAAITYSGPINLNAFVSFTWDNRYGNASFNIDGLANFSIGAAWLPYAAYPSFSVFGTRAVGFGITGGVGSVTNVPGPRGEEVLFNAAGINGNNMPDKLASGATIEPNSPWFAPAGNIFDKLAVGNHFGGNINANIWPNPAYPNSYISMYPSAVSAVATGFAGMRFNTASNTNTTGGGPKHYGWVRVEIGNGGPSGFTTAAQPSSITLLDWAYETTPDTPIMAGDGITAGPVGDFDGDLDVDGNDFLEWQRTDGTLGGLNDWEINYPTPAPVGAASSVPEPGTAARLSLGLLATGAAAVRRQRNVKKG